VRCGKSAGSRTILSIDCRLVFPWFHVFFFCVATLAQVAVSSSASSDSCILQSSDGMEVEPDAGLPPKRPRLAPSPIPSIFVHHTIATDPRGRMWPQHELHLHSDGQISVGEGPKHGKWELREGGTLQLVWHYNAQWNVKTQLYEHIPNTDSYIQTGCDASYQAVLIPKAT